MTESNIGIAISKDFLRQHHIQRLYIRYFDVVNDDNDQPTPNATIQFQAHIPQGIEVIPTVFIVNDCMRKEDKNLAQKILKRILQMNATNDIDNDANYNAIIRTLPSSAQYQALAALDRFAQEHPQAIDQYTSRCDVQKRFRNSRKQP